MKPFIYRAESDKGAGFTYYAVCDPIPQQPYEDVICFNAITCGGNSYGERTIIWLHKFEVPE